MILSNAKGHAVYPTLRFELLHGQGRPHAVSEIGKRSIFKICGRCFGDSLCYKREIVYERLRYSIFHDLDSK